jgi:antirestriction protein
MTTHERLTGQDLLAYVEASKQLPKHDLVLGAGYAKSNDKPNYTRFYEELIVSKGEQLPLLDSQPFNPKDAITDASVCHGVYIACLASYNNGMLYGEWVDLDMLEGVDEIYKTINYILSNSPTVGAEEYACHDWSGIPDFLASEHPDWADVFEYLETKERISDSGAYTVICDYENLVLTVEQFDDCYHGSHSSEADFCEDYYKDSGYLADADYLNKYIDWQRVWDGEFNCNGWHSISHSDGVYIFRPY